MPRNFGFPRAPYRRKPFPKPGPRMTRLIAAVAAGAALYLAATWPSHSIIVCNHLGCTDQHQHMSAKRHRDANGNSVSLAGIVGPLKAKAQEIVQACGSRVVSAYRPGARIPSGQLSNHARRRAVDLRGNPSCIYAHLKDWPGGYSVDYSSAPGGPHVHVSYNKNMEWGARFRHRHTRHARR